jgi:hypothetical protein
MAEHHKPLTPIERYWLEGEQPWEKDVVRWTTFDMIRGATLMPTHASTQDALRQTPKKNLLRPLS